MSNNKSGSVKTSCITKNSSTSNPKNYKPNICIPRKVITSRKITSDGADHKSCSASVVSTKRYQTKSKKTTQSEFSFTSKYSNIKTPDYCKKCGDELGKSKSFNNINKIVTAVNVKSVKNDNSMNVKKKHPKHIQQYYKNENFSSSTGSVPLHADYIRKDSLDTIKETSEPTTYSQDSLFVICSDSDDDNTIQDIDNTDNLEALKQFRNKNYFECHSVHSKIKNKPNVISPSNHECVYRFYLNDRLFPVPLNSDYNNRIRCVECQLPMDVKKKSKDGNINGTIQAKVKLGKETHDVMLLLPINESLVIKERRKETKENNDEYVYFGVVKLCDDNLVFNKTLPNDSLALRYQKGYKEFKLEERYAYKNMSNADVVII